jgi:hypothetical protein
VPTDEPVTSNQLLGTRVHAALEGKYGLDLDPVMVLDAMYGLLVSEHPDDRIELLAEREMAVTMIEGYLEWVQGDGGDALIKVVATEQDLQVPLPGVPQAALRARLDTVVYDELDESLKFMDHKTAPSFDAHDLLALNPQFKTYSVMQRLAVAGNPDAPRVSGGIINTLRRVKRTEKSRPPYYMRDRFRYSDYELDAELVRIEEVVRQILMARWQLNTVYAASGGDIEAVNRVHRQVCRKVPRMHECRWDCPFVTLCPMMDDRSDWAGMLSGSGRFRQADPYSYYRDDPLRAVRAALSEGGDKISG